MMSRAEDCVRRRALMDLGHYNPSSRPSSSTVRGRKHIQIHCLRSDSSQPQNNLLNSPLGPLFLDSGISITGITTPFLSIADVCVAPLPVGWISDWKKGQQTVIKTMNTCPWAFSLLIIHIDILCARWWGVFSSLLVDFMELYPLHFLSYCCCVSRFRLKWMITAGGGVCYCSTRTLGHSLGLDQ